MGRRTIGAPKPLRRMGPLRIESVDLEAQGIARHEGKVVFVAGGLTGEDVMVEVLRERPSYIKARAVEWCSQSPDRATPPCPHFGVCGGCSMQHATPSAQVAIKQRVLEDNLWHIGKLRPAEVLSPIRGPSLGYRARARLSVRWVDKKGGLLVGFRERASSYVAQMDTCRVLHPRAARLLPLLRDCLASLSTAKDIPQVELAVGEAAVAAMPRDVLVWVIRHLVAVPPEDKATLQAFADAHGVVFWSQAGGPATAMPLCWPGKSRADPAAMPGLFYALPAFNIRMPYSPVDFTQVNFQINRVLVSRAIGLLEVSDAHRVADFFCGLGNFSLALARRAGSVVGYEGSAALIAQAASVCELHGLQARARFEAVNLFEIDLAWLQGQGEFDRVLLDPPREGAQSLCEAYAAWSLEGGGPDRMVMVSCNPATLARDAAILVHQGAWALEQAGIVNMFPQTAHVESIAVFKRKPAEGSATRPA